MGRIVSLYEMPVTERKAKEQALINVALSEASKLTKLAPSELVVRDILPSTDLGLTNEVWEASITAANDWNNWIDVTLEDFRTVAIVGIVVLSPDPITTAIRFGIGAGPTKVIDVIQYESILNTQEAVVGYLDKPIVYRPESYMNVDLYGKSTGTEQIVLKGVTIEPSGKVMV